MTRSYQINAPLSCSPAVPARDSLDSDLHGHLSAAQIAAAALPGLPATKRGVNMVAERDGWRFIDRVGRGGGRLYAIADLPAEARAALIERRDAEVEQGVAPRGRPAGSGYFDRNPDVADALVAILSQRSVSARNIRKMLAVRFPELSPPSIRAIQRQVAAIREEKRALLASFADPDGYRSKYRVALGRADGDVTSANQVWELDTTKADVITTGGRKMILGLIDRWSRRSAFMVAESESGQAVRRFLGEVMQAWGVMPDAVMTDNGSGYINEAIKSALKYLEIEHRICPPGKPEVKPHIERLFGTFTRDRAELLDGYIGHNVADAQKERARARKETGKALILPTLTPEELQGILDAWLDGEYHLRVHSSIRKAPLAKWLSSPTSSRAAPAPDVLRIALSALVGTRRVTKRGIAWKGGRYWSPALAPWMDRDVVVRRDEAELGELYIFSPGGDFIDIAVNHERAGLSEQEHARQARARFDRDMAQAREDVRKKQRAFGYEATRDAMLRAEAEEAGKVVVLAGRTRPESSATAESIADALADRPAPAPAPHSPARPVSPPATIIEHPATPAQKVREADALIARAEAGEPVDPAELRRAQGYRTTSEYRAHRAVMDTLGTPENRRIQR